MIFPILQDKPGQMSSQIKVEDFKCHHPSPMLTLMYNALSFIFFFVNAIQSSSLGNYMFHIEKVVFESLLTSFNYIGFYRQHNLIDFYVSHKNIHSSFLFILLNSF